MEERLNPRVKEIEISGIRKIANLAASYPDAVSLTLGQPDFPTPAHILEAAKEAIDGNKTVYTHNAGLLELRHAAAAFLHKKYDLTYDGSHEVLVTVGATEALEIALQTLLTEGSEVIIPAPAYPGYEPLIRLCGGTPVHVDTTGTGFRITAEQLSAAITDKTRCVILGTPSNPTGRILDDATLSGIADVLRDKSIFVISDEIYSELVYEGKHRSIATYNGMREKTVVINGLSKSHSMTGWRIGFTCAPEYITRQMVKVHQYHVTCASSISQYAALEALTNGMDDALPMREEYHKRRDYSIRRLASMGLPLEIPEGAFYLFPSVSQFGLTSMEFTMRLLEQEKLAVVPGDAFSAYGEGYIRLSYAYGMEQLEESFNRLERFVRSLSASV
ncbi:MAG: aminotransferase A [Gorillibacterium sp.]|nr:aminotransferase A [Gorillibacterium sp.]